MNSKVNQKISLFGSYVLNRAMSNTDGLGTFPANPYSMAGEYGPGPTDIRHRVSFGGAITTKWGLQFSPLLTVNSGQPFDITTGQDLYGDTLFNSRPGLATDPNTPGVIRTSYGLLDPNPSAHEQILPHNYGRGPGIVMANLRVGKNFTFGRPREPGTAASSGGTGLRGALPPDRFQRPRAVKVPAGHRAAAIVYPSRCRSNNLGPIIDNIASPLFGQANQPYGTGVLAGTGFSESADNRRLELQTRSPTSGGK